MAISGLRNMSMMLTVLRLKVLEALRSGLSMSQSRWGISLIIRNFVGILTCVSASIHLYKSQIKYVL